MIGHEHCGTLKAKVIDGALYYTCPECGKLWEAVSRGTFKLVGEVFTEDGD